VKDGWTNRHTAYTMLEWHHAVKKKQGKHSSIITLSFHCRIILLLNAD